MPLSENAVIAFFRVTVPPAQSLGSSANERSAWTSQAAL